MLALAPNRSLWWQQLSWLVWGVRPESQRPGKEAASTQHLGQQGCQGNHFVETQHPRARAMGSKHLLLPLFLVI